MRICIVVNSVGMTSIPADIAVGLAKYTEFEPTILSWFNAEKFYGSELVDVRCVDAPNNVLGIDSESYRKARNIIAEMDVVQTHHNHSGTYAKLISHKLGIPTVSTEQNSHSSFTRKGRIANGLTNILASRVVCCSHGVYDSFKSWEKALVDRSKVEVINNGVVLDRVEEGKKLNWDLRQEIGVNADAYLVGTAGRLITQKAHDVLIRAVELANRRTGAQPMELVIAGEGKLERELRSLVDDLGVDQHVHFVGLLDRKTLYCLFDQLDVYAMPSRWEGFSGAAIEAMSTGTPCVFSSIREFTDDYDNAALFHPVDDPEELAKLLLELKEDEDLRVQYAAAARERSLQYSIQNIANSYANLYSQIVHYQNQ